MLKQLSIQNYALIQESTIHFPKGLSVITGETGAGKSILLGALGLILGNRADVAALSDPSKKCVIEAIFNIEAYNMKTFFQEQELDYEKETSIRREINPEGKSRAFINDTPVNLQVLKLLAERLIDVHSQHETLMLNEQSFQFEVLDAFAGILNEKQQYQSLYTTYKVKEKELKELLEEESQRKKDLDYYRFQWNELEQAKLVKGEHQLLEQEAATLANAEFIKTALSKAAFILEEGEDNLITRLSEVKTNIQPISRFGKKFQEISDRFNSTLIEIKDLAQELSNTSEEVVYQPERLKEINEQLDRLNHLFKKHQVNDEQSLLELKDQLEEKIQSIDGLTEDIKKLGDELKQLQQKLKLAAEELSVKRRKAIPDMEKKITELLASLAMNNAQFKMNCEQGQQLNTHGIDKLLFLFSANKGSSLNELHKVASGGELSRLMLCIKALVAELTALPTIIFDEIDTGVSGDVAHKMGGILEKMSKGMQVITITHLPQIASKGKNHLFVYKHDLQNKTVSEIKQLSGDERIVEIAKMLSTGKPTEAALLNARELIGK